MCLKNNVFQQGSASKHILDHFEFIFGAILPFKIEPKCFQKRIKKQDEFLIDFWAIFGAKWVPRWLPDRSRFGRKIDSKTIKIRDGLRKRFWIEFGSFEGSIWDRFGVDLGSIWMDLGSIWADFLHNFGSFLEVALWCEHMCHKCPKSCFQVSTASLK